MLENQKIRPAQVIGPLGEPLTLDSLPSPATTRWVVRRKAEVVAAVSGGLLSGRRSLRAAIRSASRNSPAGSARSTAAACPACASLESSNIATNTSASSAINRVNAGKTGFQMSAGRLIRG